MGLVLNLNLIHLVLIGMTSMLETLVQQKQENESEDEELVNMIMTSEEIASDRLTEYVDKSKSYDIDAVKFCEDNPDKCIQKFKVNRNVELEVIEHAPKLFRLVRRGLISEEEIMNSLIPALNYEAIHNFETGQGKSPSFFFFSDDNKIMIKTLKESEFDILVNTDFLINYVMHLVRNPDSILSRYLGVYEVILTDQEPIFFFITENQIGCDLQNVKRCYDLKGSTFRRLVKLPEGMSENADTGLMVLKDQNFLNRDEAERLKISPQIKQNLMETIKRDSDLMRRSGLIDYSIFLVEVNSQNINNSNNKMLKAIAYSMASMSYVVKDAKRKNARDAVGGLSSSLPAARA